MQPAWIKRENNQRIQTMNLSTNHHKYIKCSCKQHTWAEKWKSSLPWPREPRAQKRELSWGMWNWKVLFRDGLESQAFKSSEKLGYLYFSNGMYFLLLMQTFRAWRCLVGNSTSARRELSSWLVGKSVYIEYYIVNLNSEYLQLKKKIQYKKDIDCCLPTC